MTKSRLKDVLVQGLSVAAHHLPVRARRPRLEESQWYPIPQPDDAAIVRQLTRSPRRFFYCPVCGHRSVLRISGVPRSHPRGIVLRDALCCSRCGATNRHRQIAAVILGRHPGCPSLSALPAECPALRVLNTEHDGPLHNSLERLPGYVASEYFGSQHRSGEIVRGTLHQDLRATSFPSDHFDLVISSDVLEHIPQPYEAHGEVWRILARGGRHIMSVPFLWDSPRDEVRASIAPDGSITHHLEPEYHLDPLRPEGVLAFTNFGLESLVTLARIGFQVTMYSLQAREVGILGRHALIFELTKPHETRLDAQWPGGKDFATTA